MKALKCLCIAAVFGATFLVAAQAQAGGRSYYYGWKYYPQRSYHYTYYYYKPTPTYPSCGTAPAADSPPGRTSRARRRRPGPSPTRPTSPTCGSAAATPTGTPSSKRRSPGCTAAAAPENRPRPRPDGA